MNKWQYLPRDLWFLKWKALGASSPSADLGRLQKTSDFFGRLRTPSEIFGTDRVAFKNPSTPRIKISRLYLRKSWQVYSRQIIMNSRQLWNSHQGTSSWGTWQLATLWNLESRKWHFLGFSRGILHHRGCHVVSSEYAQRLGTMPSKRLSKCPPFNVSQI